jgi:hypothetical protein
MFSSLRNLSTLLAAIPGAHSTARMIGQLNRASCLIVLIRATTAFFSFSEALIPSRLILAARTTYVSGKYLYLSRKVTI